MTVSSTNTKNSYSGNGSTTVFAYTFKIFDDDDITVILRTDATGGETVQTKTTNYTVSGVGNAGGGNITFGTAPASGITVVLIRETAQTQTTDYTPNDPFPAASHEDALDKLTLIVQDQQEELDRSIKVSRTNTITSPEFTVGATDRANRIFAFDSNGDLSVTQEIGTYQGTDATTTTSAYAERDIVKSTTAGQLNNVYICIQASPAGTLLTNTSYWQLLVDAVTAATSAAAAASSATDAETAQTAAEAAQAAAETAQANAETAETNAETAETNAETAQAAAEAAQAAAETSETNAATSETNAGNSATSASNSASTATTKASEASTSASNAATSESNAATSETNAATSESNAATSESNAATSASNAATSASNASTSASNASTSASNASSSASAAAASAAAAASTYDTFDDRYLGSYASNPTTDNDGDPLVAGALYFNSTDNEMRVYDGAQWIAASAASQTTFTLFEYTATASQTTFSGTDDNGATLAYTAPFIIVAMNGVILDPSDYTATNGTSVVLASGAALNDIVNIYAFGSFAVADTVAASTGGTFQAGITVNGTVTADGLTVDTNTLHVDATNNRVGIGTDSPSALLHLASNAPYINFEDVDNNQDWQLQATAWFALRNQTTNSELLRITSGGNVGIGKTPSTALDVNGTVTATAFVGDGSGLTGVSAGGGTYKGENGEVNAGGGDIFRVHQKQLDTSVTIDGDENALCAGPLTLATGVTVTVTSGGTLVIA